MSTKLSSLVGRLIFLRKPTDLEQKEIGAQHSATLMVCNTSHEVVGQVEVDDLFDHEGNRFEVDIEL